MSDVALHELARLATNAWGRKTYLADGLSRSCEFDCNLTIRGGRVESLWIAWPKERWEATSDLNGVRWALDGEGQLLLWGTAPKGPRPPEGTLHCAKYESPGLVMSFPLDQEGPWARLRCPGVFGVWLWNAILKRDQKASQLLEPRK